MQYRDLSRSAMKISFNSKLKQQRYRCRGHGHNKVNVVILLALGVFVQLEKCPASLLLAYMIRLVT